MPKYFFIFRNEIKHFPLSCTAYEVNKVTEHVKGVSKVVYTHSNRWDATFTLRVAKRLCSKKIQFSESGEI